MSKEKNNQQFFPFSQTLKANLETSFGKLLHEFSADEAQIAEIVFYVISKYSEKHRFYHNLSHINALLSDAESFKEKFADYEGALLAIWFHDVIYEPQSSNNEAESAKIAVRHLSALEVSETTIEKVEKMILATRKHEAKELDSDGKLFLDLDLAILGAAESVYQKYTKAVRAEFAFVPWFLYRRERAKILNGFLNREFIYFSDELRGKSERAARRNIANEIKELS